MDLGRIRTQGISTTGKAWITNPIRSLLWHFTLPYLQGMASEVDRQQVELKNTLQAELSAALVSNTATLKQEASASEARLLERNRVELAGIRKDAMAVAHRLAGLEEEAAANELALHTFVEQLKGAASEAHEAAAYASALHNEIHSTAHTLGERIDNAVAAATEADKYVTSLHDDVRSSVEALNDRIDQLVRGNYAGGKSTVAIGQDDLLMVTTARNSRFIVREQDFIGRLVAEGKEWEPHVRQAIERFARPGAVAVDAGAYIGIHTITMARNFHTVHAFEPQRGIFQVLCGNLAINGCTNVETYQAALYDRSGLMRLAPPERQEIPTPMLEGQPDYTKIENAAALTFEVSSEESGSVRSIMLDELRLEDVALIKIDTQGADYRVLLGGLDTIRRCRPVVLFEWERDLSAQHGTNLQDFLTFFAEHDYDVTVLQETSPGRQADYLAVPK
ncbi:FkbM family methyltransferase [Paraburkholderia sp. A1RO-5]|uniref:FkbM family methyltransferase n=1 Tax=Paraburkholderia sp. A1RO-5 TaxID=3028369 RepID=UPI003B789946